MKNLTRLTTFVVVTLAGPLGCSSESKFSGRTVAGDPRAVTAGAEANAAADQSPVPIPAVNANQNQTRPTATPATQNRVAPPPPPPPVSAWTDVTTNASGGPSSCASDPARCTFRNASGSYYTKNKGIMPWSQASAYCANLNHNGMTGWRLPSTEDFSQWYAFNEVPVWLAADWANGFWTSTIYPDANNLAYYFAGSGGRAFSYLDTNLQSGVTRQDVIRGWNVDGNNVLCVK